MKIIQQITTIFTALVFLLGSMGISIYHHSCFTHHAEKTVVYPGIFQSASDCSCQDASASCTGCHTEKSCSIDAGFRPEETCDSGTGCHLEASSCCKSETLYMKLEPGFLPGTTSVEFSDLPSAFPALHPTVPVLSNHTVPPVYSFFEYYAPPFSGRALVFFLHQIKVPAFPLS